MKNIYKSILLLLFLTFTSTVTFAQSNENSIESEDNTIKESINLEDLSKYVRKLNINGWYRGFFQSRYSKQDQNYSGYAWNFRGYGDKAIWEPHLVTTIGTTVAPNTYVTSDFNYFHFWGGADRNSISSNVFQPFITARIVGTTKNKYGNFYVSYGGVDWRSQSPLTFGSNARYHRYSIWQRFARAGGGPVKERYANYYHNGSFSRDVRFGAAGFTGLTLGGWNLPKKFSYNIMIGKTASMGSVTPISRHQPGIAVIGKISKPISKKTTISIANNFNNLIIQDSINPENQISQRISNFTGIIKTDVKGIKIFSEIGTGYFQSPTTTEYASGISGIAAMMDIRTSKKHTLIPLEMRLFNISKNYVSREASFMNTTVNEIQQFNGGTLGAQAALQFNPNGISIMNVGDMANNQRGFNINTSGNIGKLKYAVGNQFSSEIDYASGSNISYRHRVNRRLISMLGGDENRGWAIGSTGTLWRANGTAYETLTTSDVNVDDIALYRRHFNSIELQLKYNLKLFGKDLYIFNTNDWNSISNRFTPITDFSTNSYINISYNELELYYHLGRIAVVSLYGGHQRMFANSTTGLGTNGLPRDQISKGIGFGLDLLVSKKFNIYYRQRWFDINDVNFPNDKYIGNTGSIELKIYF